VVKNYNSNCEVKIFKVDNFDKNIIIKHIGPNYYSYFLSIKNGKEIIKSQDDVLINK